MSNLFPDQTCVIACSGPSLNKVDCFSLGLPVVAISTAIRALKRADFWVLADYLNEMHGEEGKKAWEDSSIMKVIPKNRANMKRIETRSDFIITNVRETNLATDDHTKDLFNPGLPYFRGPHKTITMAIQWAHCNGAKKLIFAGNDLKADTVESKYAYKSESYDLKKKHNFSKTLDQVKQYISGWYPIAKSRGFEWYSWDCGPVFSSMVPAFEPHMLEEIKKK